MIIFWLITPLQSAIFSTGQIVTSQNVTMFASASLLAFDDQMAGLNGNFQNTVYGIDWLSQKLPAYTSWNYALAPFEPANTDVAEADETWSAYTTAYTTKISCVSAEITSDPSSGLYTFSDGECTTPTIELPDSVAINATNLVLYTSYYNDFNGAKTNIAIGGPNCSIHNKHKFLGIWADAKGQTDMIIYPNISAAFCTPEYMYQTVYATVNTSDGSVVSADFSVAPSLPLPASIINTTNFEYIIGVGVTGKTKLQDISADSAIAQYPQLLNYTIAFPISNMVGFAFGTGLRSASELANPTTFRDTFNKAHQILFSMAVNAMMIPVEQEARISVGTGARQTQVGAIIFVRIFSIIVEVGLAIIAILVAILWHVSHYRASNLSADPASIGTVMGLAIEEEETFDKLQDNGTITDAILTERIANTRYRLISTLVDGKTCEHLEIMSRNPNIGKVSKTLDAATSREKVESRQIFTAIQPQEFNYLVGGLLLCLITAAVVVLIVMYTQISLNNGKCLSELPVSVKTLLIH